MTNTTGLEIAVIGMAGKFPGAKNIAEFWNNLKNGVEAISFFSDAELLQTGIAPDLMQNPRYVRAKGILEDIENFDSHFFGFSPAEAALMDPQLRLCLECAWQALENAGYNPHHYDGRIGFYSGASTNLLWQIQPFLSGNSSSSGQFAGTHLSDKDFIGMRAAYALNLKGPAIVIAAACSTSLVAVDLACRALLTGQCEMALAGGVALSIPVRKGYLYEAGMVMSQDGHVRAFDAQASGTNGGDGAGMVVLKTLEDAVADRDYIHAVIKGSEANNDGNRKVGFQAPSVAGQADVIRAALHIAEVDPETIGYVETHGSGTPLGDPVEIEALTRAFATPKKQYCSIGSVKSNVGHLDSAAGVAGFIKAILVLKHKQIPPSLHFSAPNTQIDFANSPFHVNTKLREWTADETPRRAGISSFGIGGSNAHVILEEWPENRGKDEKGDSQEIEIEKVARQYSLIVLSAKTPTALEKMTENLVTHFKNNSNVAIADAAYTLQVGRKAHAHRRMAVISSAAEAIEAFSSTAAGKVHTYECPDAKRPVIFMFAGQGSQYVNMGLDLYKTEPLFRREIDRCFEILNPLLGYDLKEIMYPDLALDETNRSYKSYSNDRVGLDSTEAALLALFAFEYALVKLLLSWGIKPYTVIGYSFGQYTAACTAGIFSLEDALKLVTRRGQLINKLPPGRMLSVPLTIEKLTPMLTDRPGLSIAIDNGPSCIVSGPVEAVQLFEECLKEKRLICMPVNIHHAMHSDMMTPILDEFAGYAGALSLNKPRIPLISNITGSWISDEEATDPHHWARHIQSTVRFAPGLHELLKEKNAIFLEIGPAADLSTILRQLMDRQAEQPVLNTVRNPQQEISDHYFLLNRLGRLWLYGAAIDWRAFNKDEKRYRTPMPTYPFEGIPFPLDVRQSYDALRKELPGLAASSESAGKRPDISDWFYIPQWKVALKPDEAHPANDKKLDWLIFGDESPLVTRLMQKLEEQDHRVIVVQPGTKLTRWDPQRYLLNPPEEKDYIALFDELAALHKIPDRIVHLWGLSRDISNAAGQIGERHTQAKERLFCSLIYLAKSLGRKILEKSAEKKKIQILVVSNNMQGVTGDDLLCPEKALLLGAIRTIPKEYPQMIARSIDFDMSDVAPEKDREEKLADRLWQEMMHDRGDTHTAYRGIHRFVQAYEPYPLKETGTTPLSLRQKGVYLITGGIGGIGLTLAQYLAQTVQARLILLSRSVFPAREEWQSLLERETAEEEDSIVSKIKKLIKIEEMGSEIMTTAVDVSDKERMAEAITQAESRFGKINGIIHTAGIVFGGLIQQLTAEQVDAAFKSKVAGTTVLDALFRDRPLDFFILCSSLTALYGGVGEATYCAANAFLDAYAIYRSARVGDFTQSIDWDAWQEVGFAVAVEKRLKAAFKGMSKIPDSPFKHGILPAEGAAVFNRALTAHTPRLVVSTTALAAKFKTAETPGLPTIPVPGRDMKESRARYPRPSLSIPYAPPTDEMEKLLCETWENFLAIEQVGIHDNFFELGASSLAIVQVNTILNEILKKEIPTPTMYAYPTAAQLAGHLSGAKDEAASPPDEAARLAAISEGKSKLQQRKKKLSALDD